MTIQWLQSFLAKGATHPVVFLLAVNIICAALGLVQFGYTLAVLQPTDFAVIGVLAAIGSMAAGVLDVKLADLTTKFFFAAPEGDTRRKCALLSASLALHCLIGAVVGAIVFLSGATVGSLVLDEAPTAWWPAAVAARMATAYPVNAIMAFLRLIGDFSGAGWLRLVNQAFVTLATVAVLIRYPNLAGYFLAVAITAILSVVLSVAWASCSIRKRLGAALLALPQRGQVAEHLDARGFIAGASMAGWAKMLSRSGDILLVAALTSDATTGLYRVARQAFDNATGISDAVHQFYTPTIVSCIIRNQLAAFRKHRRRLMAIGLASAIVTIGVSALLFRPLTAVYYPMYLPALGAFEILAALLVVGLGVHGWLWPWVIARDKTKIFGALAILGAVAQLGTLLMLASVGWLTVPTAAASAWVCAAITYGPVVTLSRRK